MWPMHSAKHYGIQDTKLCKTKKYRLSAFVDSLGRVCGCHTSFNRTPSPKYASCNVQHGTTNHASWHQALWPQIMFVDPGEVLKTVQKGMEMSTCDSWM